MSNILFIVGSFRPMSFNMQFAHMAAEAIKDQAAIDFAWFQDVPYYNSEIEFPAPAAVARVREQVKKADGIWIFTPEYNGNIPGSEKNLIDWLSRTIEKNGDWKDGILINKKVAYSSCAGANGGKTALAELAKLCKFVGMTGMEEPISAIACSAETFTTNLLSLTPGVEEKAAAQAKAFLEFIK